MPRPARPGPGVLFALSLIAGCASNAPDPTADDAELVAAQAPVDDASNGFLRLEEAAAELSWSQDDQDRMNSLAEEGAWDEELVADVVGRNEAALTALERVFASPGFASRPMKSVLDDVPDMMPWIALAELSAFRAILRAQAGDAAGAYSDALAPIRLGQIVQSDASAALLHGVVGTRLKSFGYYAFASLLPLIYPSPEQSRALAGQLGALRTDPSAWRSIWTFEYQLTAPSIAEPSLAEGMENDEPSARWALRLLPDDYAYQPAETLRIYADQVRELRSYAGRPCSEVRPAPDAGGLSRILLSLSPNGGAHEARARRTAPALLRATALRVRHSGRGDPGADRAACLPGRARRPASQPRVPGPRLPRRAAHRRLRRCVAPLRLRASHPVLGGQPAARDRALRDPGGRPLLGALLPDRLRGPPRPAAGGSRRLPGQGRPRLL